MLPACSIVAPSCSLAIARKPRNVRGADAKSGGIGR
jgi:hypothetical protein